MQPGIRRDVSRRGRMAPVQVVASGCGVGVRRRGDMRGCFGGGFLVVGGWGFCLVGKDLGRGQGGGLWWDG